MLEEAFVMRSMYFFLAVVLPVILLWLTFGPKLLLVKAVWVGAGILLCVCGLMIAGAGGGVAATIGGLFFAASGVIVVITAVKSYLQTHYRWFQEHKRMEGKPHSLLDNLE
jgi:hypothetical protein